MSTIEISIPGRQDVLQFDSGKDILGSGTVGEVFRVKQVSNGEGKLFALKRFFNRAGRDDFVNERTILEALAAEPHDHIMYFLSAWETPAASYMLFPLAERDLLQFISETSPPQHPPTVGRWLVEQAIGICSALAYIHEHKPSIEHGQPNKRIGFHHDLKPANILLFASEGTGELVWKLGDFGSGAVKVLPASSTEELYNRKASTGDPVYSAPEYVIDGRVSRPKDIWSLGCILLEVLVWVLTPEKGAISRFEKRRDAYSKDNPDNAPVYWCQRADGKSYLNPAVPQELDFLRERCELFVFYQSALETVKQMIDLDPKNRPTALQVCEQLDHCISTS